MPKAACDLPAGRQAWPTHRGAFPAAGYGGGVTESVGVVSRLLAGSSDGLSAARATRLFPQKGQACQVMLSGFPHAWQGSRNDAAQ